MDVLQSPSSPQSSPSLPGSPISRLKSRPTSAVLPTPFNLDTSARERDSTDSGSWLPPKPRSEHSPNSTSSSLRKSRGPRLAVGAPELISPLATPQGASEPPNFFTESPGKRNAKVISLMGREAAPAKAMSRLGSTTLDRNSMRLADDALKAEQAKQRARLLKTVLLQRPGEDMLAPPNRSSTKAAQMLGESKIAAVQPKAAEVLGSSDGDVRARTLADQAIRAERADKQRRAMETVVAAQPSAAQLRLPDEQLDRPVSVKALQMLGDEGLSLEAVKLGGSEKLREQGVNNKALQMSGSSLLAPSKARARIGSSTHDGEARVLADKVWGEERARQHKEALEKTLKLKPSEQQLEVPSQGGKLPRKVLSWFGHDAKLLESVPKGRVTSPKAIALLGHPELAGKKAGKKIGSPERDKDAMRRANEAFIEEQRQSSSHER